MINSPTEQRNRKFRKWEGVDFFSALFMLGVLIWELGWSGLEYQFEEASLLRWVREIMCFLVFINVVSVWGMLRTKKQKLPVRRLYPQLVLGLISLGLLLWGFIDTTHGLGLELINLRRGITFLQAFLPLLSIKSYILGGTSNLERYWRPSNLPPALIFLISLIGIIAVGGALLLTPRATYEPISCVDAFFVSTSAVCVTGLTPVNVSSVFTPFGKVVLLGLFQLGAIGIMTFTYFISMIVGQGLTLRERVTMSQLLDEEGLSKTALFIKSIIGLTLLIELLGAVGLWFAWKDVPAFAGQHVWWYALFHSVSAFCNAGFSVFPDNLATACVADNRWGQAVIMMVVVSGSLGFAVYLELVKRFRKWLHPGEYGMPPRWSTHIWLVRRMTILLIFGGAVILFLFNILDQNRVSDHSWPILFWEDLFNTCVRTAGFNITDLGLYCAPYALFLTILMFIGGNPGSTTGGVHTTVFAIACGEIRRILTGNQNVEFHNRRIARSVVERAVITVIISGFWVGLMVIVLCLIEPKLPLVKIIFEVVSSFATVGFSMGITPELSTEGKLLITFNMIIGRVGMFSFLLAILGRPKESLISYPETKLPLS